MTKKYEMEQINLRSRDIEEIIKKLYEATEEYISAFISHKRYKEGSDEYKSQLMSNIAKERAEKKLPVLNRNQLLDASRASELWTTYLNLTNKLEEKMLHLENVKDTWKTAFDAKRSILADEREKRKAGLE